MDMKTLAEQHFAHPREAVFDFCVDGGNVVRFFKPYGPIPGVEKVVLPDNTPLRATSKFRRRTSADGAVDTHAGLGVSTDSTRNVCNRDVTSHSSAAATHAGLGVSADSARNVCNNTPAALLPTAPPPPPPPPRPSAAQMLKPLKPPRASRPGV